MIESIIETELLMELRRIAPEVDPADVDRKADLREQFDIDSMDFLNLISALSTRFRLPIPEEDYPGLSSFDALTAYLVARTK